MTDFFFMTIIREGLNGKKCFLSGIAQMRGGGGLPMPEFFGTFSRRAFLVNRKKRVYFFKNANVLNFYLFFMLLIYLPPRAA